MSFRIDWLDPCSPRDSQESSPAARFQSIDSSTLSLPYSPALTSIHDYWTRHSTDYKGFVDKVMSLLLNTLSRFLTAFLPRSRRLLISWLQSPSPGILEPKKRKSVTALTFSSSIYCEVMGPHAMILVFLMLSFKPAFWLSSFTLIKRPFSSSSLCYIRMVSFANMRLLVFLPAFLLPACDSFSLVFCMMYSA